MRLYAIVQDTKYEIQDAYSLPEPIMNTSIFWEGKRMTVVKVDVMLIPSGHSCDIEKIIYLEG